MKNTLAKVVLAAFVPVITLSVVQAAVPSTATQNVPGKMNYQGYLRNPSTGDAYTDGIYTLDCRIYNSDSGGTCLWGGRYSAYVKDGYFNIMLGDESATQNLDDMTGITYTGAANLWKALWGANATDNARFLGVTPLQDANNATISSPTEILPRQQLLTTPFAFRAQSAQYASEAAEDFTVAGDLTVKGTTTFSGTINAQSGTQRVGPIQASSTSVNLGNGYTAATSSTLSSLPSYLYGVSKYIYLYSYYSMNFKPTAGNINFTVPSGYDMNVTGSGDFISDVPVHKIGGSSGTTIKGSPVNVSGSTVKIMSNSSAEVSVSGSTVSITGSVTKIRGADIHLLPKSAGSANYGIFGQGEVKWAPYNQNYTSDSDCEKPFVIKTIAITIPAGSTGGGTLISRGSYNWMVVGMATTAPSAVKRLEVSNSASVNNCTVYLILNTATTTSVTIDVHLLGIHKNFSSDER